MSQLQGNQISDTFNKLIQIDTSLPVTGDYTFNFADALSSDVYTLLDGTGKRHKGIVIDQSNESSGGLFLKNAAVYGFQNSGNKLKIIKDNGIQLAFLRNTGTFHIGGHNISDITDYTLYVDRGIKSQNRITSSDGLSGNPNKRLNISARNHFITTQPDGFNNYLNQTSDRGKNYDIFKSGIYSDSGIRILWQRSGSVVTCNGWIDHQQYGIPYSYDLPTYVSDTGLIRQFEDGNIYEGLIGNGTNTLKGEIIVVPNGNDSFEIHHFNNNTNNESLTSTGVSYFSFSYRFVE